MTRNATIKRTTRETDVSVTVEMESTGEPEITTGLPFFDHMLAAMSHHGRFRVVIKAHGDTDVDPHHLVEDTGIVLGQCFDEIFRSTGSVKRFSHHVVPMDEALSEATVDVCGRATLRYDASFPQDYSGDFPMWLFREFFLGLVGGAKFSLHLRCRYGENAHHMIESLFKALGRALGEAYTPDSAAMSTKGSI